MSRTRLEWTSGIFEGNPVQYHVVLYSPVSGFSFGAYSNREDFLDRRQRGSSGIGEIFVEGIRIYDHAQRICVDGNVLHKKGERDLDKMRRLLLGAQADRLIE